MILITIIVMIFDFVFVLVSNDLVILWKCEQYLICHGFPRTAVVVIARNIHQNDVFPYRASWNEHSYLIHDGEQVEAEFTS